MKDAASLLFPHGLVLVTKYILTGFPTPPDACRVIADGSLFYILHIRITLPFGLVSDSCDFHSNFFHPME